jgi:hypothetical protein
VEELGRQEFREDLTHPKKICFVLLGVSVREKDSAMDTYLETWTIRMCIRNAQKGSCSIVDREGHRNKSTLILGMKILFHS